MEAEGVSLPAEAFPLADGTCFVRVLETIQIAQRHKLSRKGLNETLKAIHRNAAAYVAIAADADPIDIVMSLPESCEQRGVPFVFVPSGDALGRAAGLSAFAAAIVILNSDNEHITPLMDRLVEATERLYVL
ncbi:H/ACA ribonucleoprotein complex, subunit Nhp2, eukaryote [Kipferlia bialata]|uniref:H/ACA ribonucleoprotein complex subunit 2 n=1 Tax=Kipferlia bialata TaxID=797122 RepID=A0A391NP55_9EUKA|nr:H/ACA ribonucleoprotein complex, subunit Nhp2, eukaryote [Kipferlia bialata]|eukprot:g9476.t1